MANNIAETPEDVVSKDELRKVDHFPKAYIMRDKYAGLVHKNLKKNLNMLIKHIALYREANLHKLQTPYPDDYPIWKPNDTSIYFKVCEIDEKEFFDTMLELRIPSDYTMKKKYIRDKAVHAIEMMILREMIVSKYDQKYIDILLYYIGYSNYWQAYTVIFKYNPSRAIVEYAVNNMSNRFLIKQFGSVDKLIFYGSKNAVDTYKDDILEASDYKSFMWIPDRITTKFKGYVKGFAAPIFDAIKNKNAIFTAMTTDEEGKDKDNETSATDSVRYADKHVNLFLSSSVKEKWLLHVAKNNGVSDIELRNTVNLIKDNPDNYSDVLSYFQSMLYIFLVSEKKLARDIKTKSFIIEMNRVYKKGNTKDKNVIAIKYFLNKWLKEGSKTFRQSTRPDTINRFRRALFEYIVLDVATK